MNITKGKKYSQLTGRLKLRSAHILLLGIATVVLIAGLRLRDRLVVPEVIPPPPLLVETERTVPHPFVVTSSYSGSVVAEKRATLSARLASTVKVRNVKEGDVVEKGQTLLRLDDTEQQQELQRLTATADRISADLEYWRGQLKVDRRLFGKGSISEQKLQDTIRQVAALNASLEENRTARAMAMTHLSYAEVVAPFSGVVQSVLVEEGETVSPGSPLLEFVDTKSLSAVISAPQVDRRRLTPGLRVYLRLHQLAVAQQGEIMRIYPALDSRSRNLTLEIPLQHEKASLVQPGMSVEAVVELKRFESAITVPLHAVQQRLGQEGVFVVREGHAVWQPVTAGIIQDDRVQLIEGIVRDEEVITTPHSSLAPGCAVQVYQGSGPVLPDSPSMG